MLQLIEVTNDYLILLSSKNYYAISPPSFSLPRKKLDMRYLRCSGHYGDAIDYRDMSSSHAIKYRCRKTVNLATSRIYLQLLQPLECVCSGLSS